MNYQRLWELILQNAKHIETMNHEMGGIEANVEMIMRMMHWGLGILSAIFVGMLVNILMTKRNGKKK